MARMLKEMLPTYSDRPLLEACRMGSRSIFPGTIRSELRLWRLEKYHSGKNPPTQQASIDAAAAPARPHLKTTMKRASRTMFVTAQMMDMSVPSCGRSAVM